ncbi:MAG: phosphotransferase, partial [Myxococcota bacterium]
MKLRSGVFDETSVSVPSFLAEQGIAEIIQPLATRAGKRFAGFAGAALIVYPFVAGCSALEIPFSERHWLTLGSALARVHAAVLPRSLSQQLRRESGSPKWRERLNGWLAEHPGDAELVALLSDRRSEIQEIVERAERLASSLDSRELVLCHSDLHAGNVLIDADGDLFVVDWDDPILAPRERDLMFPGGAQGFLGHTPEGEEALFARGYGRSAADPSALAYYRYERIIQDMVVYGEDLL